MVLPKSSFVLSETHLGFILLKRHAKLCFDMSSRSEVLLRVFRQVGACTPRTVVRQASQADLPEGQSQGTLDTGTSRSTAIQGFFLLRPRYQSPAVRTYKEIPPPPVIAGSRP